MKNTTPIYLLTITILSFLAPEQTYATEANKLLLRSYATSLQEDQQPTGAFYPNNCLDKAMTKKCYGDASLFFTGLIAESFEEHPDQETKKVHEKALSYLANQFKEQKGTLRYYETTAKLYRIVKPDVDDNGIVLSTLMNHPELADQKLILEKVKYLFDHSVIDHTFTRKNSALREKFTGRYLSTWVNPTKPFFNDVDLVVNFNGLLAFSKYNTRVALAERVDLTAICSTVNQIISWSAHDNFEDLTSNRHWIKREPKNYSQWYPSKYAAMFSLVRSHLTMGPESCLQESYQLVRKHLLSTEEFGQNAYDQALATAAVARIIRHEKLPTEGLETQVLKLHDMLEKNQLGKHPFFFYGAVGYTASKALLKALMIEALKVLLPQERIPASVQIEEVEFLNKVLSEQLEDGSFTALIKPSSPLYNIFVVFLYEYLGLTEKKKEINRRLLEHVFSQQKSSGALAGYPDGPDHVGISAAGYTAAKIAGYPETDPRMQKLEARIKGLGGPLKSDMLTLPFLMMFSLHPLHTTHNLGVDRLFMKFNESLPWVKVLIHPVLYLIDNGHNRVLSREKYPSRIFKQPYEKYAERLQIPNSDKSKTFLDWATANMNPDGTFFDYTPTTVPMLMALSNFPEEADTVEAGLRTIESFQETTKDGNLLQTPGEASIGETFYIANSLLDVGYDHTHPAILKAEKYLLEHQLKTGGWGFSKNSVHFADSDDTSNAMYLLIRLDKARGKTIRPEMFKALDWLLTLQNKDGGFGTWERTKGGFIGELINKVANKKGLVMAESVFEHTARIVVCLSFLKDINPEANEAFHKAYSWLLRQQKKDGSFDGTWFVNYMFSTSMAMTALGTIPDEKGHEAIKKSIQYLKKVQSANGGFGESPDSFLEGKAVPLSYSSWAQTGLIAAQLHTLNMITACRYKEELKPLAQTTFLFLRDEKAGWINQMDPTWTAVTFPKVEYLIYPYIQRLAPWQAYNMHLTSPCF